MALTYALVRDAALRLPSVSEGTSYGTPCLRVGKTLIARLREDGQTLVLKIDLMERDILTETDPATFFTTDHYRGYPLVLVNLSPDRNAVATRLVRRRAKAIDQTFPIARHMRALRQPG